MLTKDEFELYCRRLNFTDKAIRLIRRIRSSPPSRRVGGGGRSVCARYPSKKMGVTIQAESSHCELVFVYECEYDDDVLEYYCQPNKIKLQYKANGRNVGFQHTPDFFVLHREWAGWIECKLQKRLIKELSKSSKRYALEDSGEWHCPPGETYAERYGLQYRVWTPSATNWILQRNLRFLETYFKADHLSINSDAKEEVLQTIRKDEGIRLSVLKESLRIANMDTIHSLIALGEIYVNLESQALAEPDYVFVFSNADMAESYFVYSKSSNMYPGLNSEINLELGNHIHWNDGVYEIVSVGEKEISLKRDKKIVELPMGAFEELVIKGKITGECLSRAMNKREAAYEIFLSYSPEDQQKAHERLAAIKPILDSKPVDSTIPERTLRYWVSKYKRAKRVHNLGLLGLLDDRRKQGNRNMKMDPDRYEAMIDFISKEYENEKSPTIYAAYCKYRSKCRREGFDPPNYRSFCKAIHGRNDEKQTEKRMGSRASYQVKQFHRIHENLSSRHGDRPFEIAHIDHTLADIELVHSNTGRTCSRCWITLLEDAFSRRVLAIYASYDPPSYRSCMMTLRECVRRFGRLPETIISDRGPEFQSVYYETLLAAFDVTKKTRPPASARHGSLVERLFGTINTQFLYTLAGNTQITKNVRQVTKDVNPKHLAKWTLPIFYERLCKYCYEVYDTIDHSELGMSPREKFLSGMSNSGDRPQRLIPYDENFWILTMPTTRKGTAKVDPQRGVKINYIYYHCQEFRNPDIARKDVPVRYDPFNIGIAYAYVNGRWETCYSERYMILQNRSEREMAWARKEILKARKDHNRRYRTITAKTLGDFYTSNDAIEDLLDIQMKDAESKQVHDKIAGISSDDSDTSQRRIGPNKDNPHRPSPGDNDPDQSPPDYLKDDDAFDNLELSPI